MTDYFATADEDLNPPFDLDDPCVYCKESDCGYCETKYEEHQRFVDEFIKEMETNKL